MSSVICHLLSAIVSRMALPPRLKFGVFMAPFHQLGEDPTLALERDLELIQWLDYLDFDEAWIGEHHSAGWEIIASPEIFIGVAADRTKHIKLGTGVTSLPYHHPLMVANRMVLLDHMTRGRVMLGVGPGALVTDALMLGIEPNTQRPRMDEAMGVILRLLTDPSPFTYEGDWFALKDARLHLRPYTQPHFPLAVAAAASPSGMVLAGKYGLGVLSISGPRGDSTLADYWNIAEQTAAEHGRTVKREEWRLVMQVHLAETREQALAEVRQRAGVYWRDYFEGVMGFPKPFEAEQDEIVDMMNQRRTWCIGTPDDLIATIERLDEQSGGFGGLLVTSVDWATREQIMHSYELIARYVKPRFQGSLVSLAASEEDARRRADQVNAARVEATTRARDAYEQSTGQSSPLGPSR
jgi:limonene 1,2-monooxygenase